MSRPITATVFSELLARLGIRNPEPFELEPNVFPVAVVDSDVALTVSTPIFGVPFSTGEQAGVAANQRLADTGPQPAGDYAVLIWISGAANNFRVRRRNAADAADIWSIRMGNASDLLVPLNQQRFTLATDERLVIEVVSADAVNTYQAAIWLTVT